MEAEAEMPTLFRELNLDDGEEPETSEIPSFCINCQSEDGTTRLLLTKIPFFKEIILMSFSCPHCGFSNSETQFGGKIQEMGVRYQVLIRNEKDLNRQVVKSDCASVNFPELELEIPAQTQKGEITTVEGIINRVIAGLEQDQLNRETEHPDMAKKIEQFIQKLKLKKEMMEPFHLNLTDPSGNSFVENPLMPQKDPDTEIVYYNRSKDDDLMLGLQEIAQDDDEDLAVEEVFTFHTNCYMCNSPCETRMKPTKIPHFKEVVIMATNCERCGHRTNEVKSGSGIEPLGMRIKLHITNREDLSRDVLKSETCRILIPELEMEFGGGILGGRFTTIEGLLENIKEQIQQDNPLLAGDSADTGRKQKFKEFLQKLDKVKLCQLPAHIILDDPAGNSYVQNIFSPDQDPEMEITHYERTFEENEELGLNDMKTEMYENN